MASDRIAHRVQVRPTFVETRQHERLPAWEVRSADLVYTAPLRCREHREAAMWFISRQGWDPKTCHVAFEMPGEAPDGE
jgi:hypothetical protein